MEFRKAAESDMPLIKSLLETTKLPIESVQKDTTEFYVATDSGQILGVAGFEFYENDALLRSVAVRPDVQRSGIGSQIVDFMLTIAHQRDVHKVALLTETAKDFFLKKNFRVVDRSSIKNEAMKRSSEFAFACPESAVCMVLKLQ